ncbi:MAG TPA: TonB-dependent receptor [Terricaulis sp.]|nr:TonB-dependent receptor [Terricaulis sp.]
MAQTADDTVEDGEIVVTGSRIARRDFSSPTPILTTNEAAIQESGVSNIEETMNVLPQFVAAGDATTTGRAAQGQRASLNLRGLGANRNLVLLDGRRLPFANAQGVIDVNIIPSALIRGVETITGGASAVYGSDAMSGVVNFQTRRDFEGLQLDVQYGDTFEFDRQTYDTSLTGGGSFADDRGRFSISVGHSERERLRGTERKHMAEATPSGFFGAGAYIPTTGNLPDQTVLNAIFQGYDGLSTTVPRSGGAANIGFNDDGSLFLVNSARNYRGPTSGDYFILNGQVRHPFGPTIDVTSAQERTYAFGQFGYDITPNIEAYVQFLYVDSETDQDDGWSLTQYGTLVNMPTTNPFIPADLATILASRPDPTADFQWNTRYVGVGHKGFNERLNVWQGIVGLRGDLGFSDWTFDIHYSADQTDSVRTVRNAVVKEFVEDLYYAPDGGASICAGGFNPFGDANAMSLSAECANYITVSMKDTQAISQDIFEAAIQGSLFELPAGPLQFSLVAGRREQSYAFDPDSRARVTGAIEAISAQVPAAGEITVNEISGELLIPLLRDAPFAESLELGVAYRYSDYNYAGGNSTYKVDATWTPVSGLLFRGGYARAVRAPNMAESFFDRQASAAPIGTPPTGGDPCDIRTPARAAGGATLRQLCIDTGIPAGVIDSFIVPTSSAGNSITSGNPNLRPEVADTYTLGMVVQPRFGPDALQNLQFSIDYYDITIEDVIGSVAAINVLNSCYNQDGANPGFSATNVYCTLLHRDNNGILTSVDTPFLNLGGLHVRGIDFAAEWNQEVGPGELSLSTVISYKLNDETKDFANSPWVEFVGTGTRYRFHSVSSIAYTWGPARVGLRFRYTGAQDDATSVTRPASPAPGADAFLGIDLNASYRVNDAVEIRAGVNNLYQPDAPLPNLTVEQTSGSLYDAVGRQFYVAFRAKF